MAQEDPVPQADQMECMQGHLDEHGDNEVKGVDTNKGEANGDEAWQENRPTTKKGSKKLKAKKGHTRVKAFEADTTEAESFVQGGVNKKREEDDEEGVQCMAEAEHAYKDQKAHTEGALAENQEAYTDGDPDLEEYMAMVGITNTMLEERMATLSAQFEAEAKAKQGLSVRQLHSSGGRQQHAQYRP